MGFRQCQGLFSFMDKEFERSLLLLPRPNRSLVTGEALRRPVLRARGERGSSWGLYFSSPSAVTRSCVCPRTAYSALRQPPVKVKYSKPYFPFSFFPAAVFWTCELTRESHTSPERETAIGCFPRASGRRASAALLRSFRLRGRLNAGKHLLLFSRFQCIWVL